MLTICMKTAIMNRNAFFYKQALSLFLGRSIQTPLQGFRPEDDDMTMEHVSQEAGGIVSISGISPLTHTPPQVDKYRCRDRRAWNVAQVARDWPIYGADQEKDGKRKPDKTKPDKSKRENDKGLKKTKPPKRDGLASIL